MCTGLSFGGPTIPSGYSFVVKLGATGNHLFTRSHSWGDMATVTLNAAGAAAYMRVGHGTVQGFLEVLAP